MNEITNSIVSAITGGIGTGKSTVAKHYESQGFPVIFTDNLAKTIMSGNPEVKQKLISAFGDDIYINGKVNSEKISSIVFGDTPESTEMLGLLNSIVHPPVIDEMIKQVESLEIAGNKLIFVESALIFEAELDEGFDYIITVIANEENAIKRTTGKTGMDPEAVLKRINAQMPNSEKASMSDFVIENNENIDELHKAADIILNILKAL